MSINKFIGVGRLTRDPKIDTASGSDPFKIAKFTIAIDRNSKNSAQKADFVPCVAYRNRAEFAEKYLHQGDKVVVEGKFTSGSFKNSEGNTVYTTEITVDSIDFAGKKPASAPETDADGFMTGPDMDEMIGEGAGL